MSPRLPILIIVWLFVNPTALSALDTAAAYRAWAQGRPEEAVTLLAQRAREDDSWAAWYDYGLAAAAAGKEGPAVAALLKAHLHAPHRREPRRALGILGRQPPASWVAALGPVAWLSLGPIGCLLALIGGCGLGWGLLGRQRRLPALVIAAVCLAAVTPGLVAQWYDGGRHLIATVDDTVLLDGSGATIRRLPAGTILELRATEAWEGRWLVRTDGGLAGAVPRIDCGEP